MLNGKISSVQLAVIMFQFVLSSTVLLMPSITTRLSEKDMWLTPLLGMGLGFLVVWLAYKLFKLSPEGSIVRLMESLFGTFLGKIVSILFILFQFHIVAISTRDYAEFIESNFFLETPIVVIIGTMLILCGWAVRRGFEVIARTGQIFVPIITLFTVLILILLIPELNPLHLLPFMERGAGPLLQGSLVVDGWFSQLLLAVYIFPLVRDQDNIRKWGFWCVIGITFVMLASNLAVFMLVGESAGYYTYPVLMAARYIAYAEFFEHLEAIVMMVWVLGEYIKISVYYYVITRGISDTFRLKKPEVIVMPVGLLLLFVCFWVGPDFQTVSSFIANTGTSYILIGFVLFPLLLCILAVIRGWFKGLGTSTK
ncbi:GerAB/ArcD/ProY family transporter [Paenibacillus paeoniae]|uniref:Uncharacterized protein n=1 Tax=Paenibacillus paeoniae TaxID=2292705 RepID=A0A371PLI2_9BACL|nr:endospore germination permease [Paenibacillus paeoniae]REK77064.1 hypothetical protein DX130_08675 [Paenibacillus paeoniae]